MEYDINKTADDIIHRIKNILIITTGKIEEEASLEEFYHAFCIALRKEIMVNWVASAKTMQEKNVRTLYYLSMEYLPGKFFENNITNLNASNLLKAVLQKTNRPLGDLIACDPDPGLGNGGLGRLASCFLDSLASQHYPSLGYGLRYQYGIFDQEIWNGVQVERPDCWLLNENPWEFRRDAHARTVDFKGRPIFATNSHGDEAFLLEDSDSVRALPYDVPILGYTEDIYFSIISLRLWTTKESPRNFGLQRYNAGQLGEAGENASLTDVLYPNDNHDTGKRIRLKQEFLLVSASLQDIISNHIAINGNDIYNLHEKVQIQINDTHPALIIAELMRRLVTNHDVPWDKAWEITQNTCNYTNHTILKEALEEWNEKRMAYLLPRQHRVICKLNELLFSVVKNRFPENKQKLEKMSLFGNGQIRMANLAIFGSKKVNGVSELHTELLTTTLFKDFFELFPEKFIPITNGVTPRRWLLCCNPKLSQFISERIGSEWICNFEEINKLREFAKDPKSQEDFLQIKKENKETLINFLEKENPIRNNRGKIVCHCTPLGPDALFDIHIKRIHEYKRQLMNALHIIMIYHELKENPNSRKVKRMMIIGGKAAPGYETAKQIIRLFFCIARKINNDPDVNQLLNVAYVENYNVSKAELLIPAADISEQISTAGLEASGTGNMKLSMNGALTIGTQDGANIEMKQSVGDEWWPFTFGKTANELDDLRKNHVNPAWDIYIKNEKIRKAIESLKDGTFTSSDSEQEALLHIYDLLLDGHDERSVDPYFILTDLEEYYETQKKVDELYADPKKWAEFAINNIAGMGRFSSDVTIHNYAKSIWNLEKCPPTKEMLEKIRQEFLE